MARHGARQEEPQAAVMAGRSREVPLLPAALVSLEAEPAWVSIAERVRDLTAGALEAGDYPIAEAACGDRESLNRLRDRVFDVVAAETLRDSAAAEVVALWSAAARGAALPARDLDIPGDERVSDPSMRLEAVLEDVCDVLSTLIEARLEGCPISPVDLVAWAREVGWAPLPALGERLIVIGDRIHALVVAVRGDLIVVERAEDAAQVLGPDADGTAAAFLAAVQTVDDAVRLVVAEIGAARRVETRRPLLRRAEVAQGCTLEEGPTATHLTWDGGSAEFPPGRVGRFRAIDFSHLASASPRLIMASYTHEHGHPIFEPPLFQP